VIFKSDISDEELAILYENAMALVMPSLMEGFGLPAVEAMANNCLVLASSIPSLKEICENTAVYFDPYDIGDIAQKLDEVLAGKYKSYKELGLKRAKEFSWKKMAEETLKIYETFG
jgi:glycosyltransferase involved in cell wall biosynthesis